MNFQKGILESRRLHYKHLSKLLVSWDPYDVYAIQSIRRHFLPYGIRKSVSTVFHDSGYSNEYLLCPHTIFPSKQHLGFNVHD